MAADRGEHTLVAIAERRDAGSLRTRRAISSPRIGPAAWRPGRRPATAHRRVGRRLRASPMTNIRDGRAPRGRRNLDPAARGGGHPEPSRERRGFDPRAPDDIRGLEALALRGDTMVVDRLYRRIEQHLNPHPLERTDGEGGKLLGKPGQYARAASTNMMRAVCGLMWRKSRDSVACASSANAPAISTPVGPAPTRRMSTGAGVAGSARGFRLLKGEEYAPADQVASSSDLSPGARRRPIGMAEIVVLGSGGQDQPIVGPLAPDGS